LSQLENIMSKANDVVIIGGGAAGCATAYYLAKAGVNAIVIEREGIAANASGYNAGGLNPLQGAGIPGPLASFALESFQMHQELGECLRHETDIEFHYKSIVMVQVAFDERELSELQETLTIFQNADGFSAHGLDPDDLFKVEPRLSSAAIQGLYTYGNATLSSYEYVTALSQAAQQLGSRICPGMAIGLKTAGDRVTGVILEDGELDCESVVVASGPWSEEAGRWLGVPIPVEPLKGEIVRIEPPGPPLKADFSGAGSSLYQRADGLIWIGSTEERAGFDKEPSELSRQHLLEAAIRLMPSIREANVVKHTACLRPVTSDWLPIIGRAPGWANVYLATGAGKKGILLSPGIGQATADLITKGQTGMSIGPFAPDRFSA
jgi:glycine oxidase